MSKTNTSQPNALQRSASQEIASGKRFEFGKNWKDFLSTLSSEQIGEAEYSLQTMLGVADLQDTTFLDAGSGSGLFSFAARRLRARVHSFDFDPQSVACSQELKNRFNPNDPDWTIQEGSVLDRDYLESLGKFDMVYSWGVLHHTGSMWKALDNITVPVKKGGRLFIAIYNHQLYWTRLHTWMKRTYVLLPRPLNWLFALHLIIFQILKGLAKDLSLLRNPIARYRYYSRSRGMSWWHDCLDWIGGYPFETATPHAIFNFFQQRGFVLERIVTCGGGSGCNQFVFRKAVEQWNWSKHPYTLTVTPVEEEKQEETAAPSAPETEAAQTETAPSAPEAETAKAAP